MTSGPGIDGNAKIIWVALMMMSLWVPWLAGCGITSFSMIFRIIKANWMVPHPRAIDLDDVGH